MSRSERDDVTTSFHARYWAHALTLRGATGSIEALAGGVVLADEVGLGKTIETGIVISQRWTERKRKRLEISDMFRWSLT